jgi:hypothetical protein
MATIIVPPFAEVVESSSLAIKTMKNQKSIRYIEGDDLDISRITCTTIGSRFQCSEAYAEVKFRRGR